VSSGLDNSRISSFCPNANCVQASITADGDIAVHHTKNPQDAPHVFSREEWTAFVSGVKAGEFDILEGPDQHIDWRQPRTGSLAHI
jgi:hypothetical protein